MIIHRIIIASVINVDFWFDLLLPVVQSIRVVLGIEFQGKKMDLYILIADFVRGFLQESRLRSNRIDFG